MTTESFKRALKAAKRDERHHTVAETRYWLEQYRMLAYQAIAAMEEAEKQEPVAWAREHELPIAPGDAFSWVETLVHKTPLYTTPPAAPVQFKCTVVDDENPAGVPLEQWLTGCPECGMNGGCDCDSGTWNPPEAQRLADLLETDGWPDAAAELRRLEAAHDWQYKMAGDRLRRIEKLERISAQLLEALEYCRQKLEYAQTNREWYSPGRAIDMADAAIAAAKGDA